MVQDTEILSFAQKDDKNKRWIATRGMDDKNERWTT